MIKRKATHHRGRNDDSDPGLDISSLIDVSFLLLIYFLITSTIDPRESDLRLSMGYPGGGAEAIVIDTPRISVDSAGIVSMDGEVLDANPDVRDLIQLEDRLSTLVQVYDVLDTGDEPSVELEVDDSVRGQRFVDVMNCLAGVGITKITLIDFAKEQ